MDAYVHVSPAAAVCPVADQIIHLLQSIQTFIADEIQRDAIEFREVFPKYHGDDLLMGEEDSRHAVLCGVLFQYVVYVKMFGHGFTP